MVRLVLVAAAFVSMIMFVPSLGARSVLLEGEADEPSWVAIRFQTRGGDIRLDLLLNGTRGNVVLGEIILYNEAGEVIEAWLDKSSGYSAAVPPRSSGLYLDSRLAGIHVDDRSTQLVWHSSGAAYWSRGLPAGTYTIVGYAASELQHWRFAFAGEPDVVPLAWTIGPARLLDGRDFSGVLAAQAYPLNGSGGASVHVSATADVEVAHTLLAVFQEPGGTIKRPDGRVETCPCTWHELVGPEALTPGDYMFSLRGARGGEPVLALADIELPR